MLSYPLTNFKIQKYFQNGPKFNGVYSRNNLPEIRGGEYIIQLDEYESVGNHWIAPYVNDGNGTQLVMQHTLIAMGNKNIVTNICSIQAYILIMCGYFCVGFIDFMLKSKSLLDYTSLVPPNEYEKNDKIILKYF